MKKGQTFPIAILFAIFLFIFGYLFINFLKPEIQTAQTSLSCSDTTISDGSKILCLMVDGVMPYFIITILSAAGGLILSKLTV